MTEHRQEEVDEKWWAEDSQREEPLREKAVA